VPDHSSDAAAAPTQGKPGTESTHESATPSALRADWRLGGRTVLHWQEGLLATAMLSLGAGMIAGTLVGWLWESPWAAASAAALLGAGMLVPVVFALSRSRPEGLLRFRALDLLYGAALGGLLRLAQGWIELASEGRATFPAYPLVDGRMSDAWWLTEGVAVVVAAPIVEEFFFRGVVLVALYTVLRGPFGHLVAGPVSVIASTGLFFLVHLLVADSAPANLLATALLGVVCSVLVVLTGRIWGAVLVHVVYNATYVTVAVVGTIW
jgi:membrane protease YdiL (CAAX protease family)